MREELLAQLIEEVAILAADRRRREPRTVPRPYHDTPRPAAQSRDQGGPVTGHRQMLAAAVRRGMVRSG